VWLVLAGAVAVLIGGIIVLSRRRRHDEDRV
jgi:LPXTG-motif cell wall-anchored protein